MPKYEYQFVTVEDTESIIEKLNAAGQAGWRLTESMDGSLKPSYLMEREVNGVTTEDPKFKGDDTIMVWIHDGPNGYGPCRFQNEVHARVLAEKSPSNIYHFLHA